MDEGAFDHLLDLQDHVFTRSQVIGVGGDDSLIRRRIRRREWAVVWPGVMVDHTGAPSRAQREWAAVLYYAPAALTGRSALSRYGVGFGSHRSVHDAVVDVAVDRSRRVVARPGTRIWRTTALADRTLINLSPPLVRLEHAVLDLASRAEDEIGLVAVLADACQSRRTTARRLLDALEERPRLRGRRLMKRVLDDIGAGANSVLEWLFLTRIERPHGLPIATRQHRVGRHGTSSYRDVDYRSLGVVVELDGRVGHTRAIDRWDDLDRDVAAAIDGTITVRLGWRQVAEPCRTARALSRILQARGWPGRMAACSRECG